VVDASYVLLFNAHHEPAIFLLPPRRFGSRWLLELSTAEPGAEERLYPARAELEVEARSIVVLRRG
jgi:glycogen operon protein